MRFERIAKEKFILRPQTRNHPPEYLRRLADSLLQAQLQPVGALNDYTLIFGNGRVLAARMEPKITHLYAAILDEEISEKEFKRRQAVENFVRNDLSNAEKCKIAVEYAKSAPSMTLKQIAGDLGVDASMVTRWMAWDRCIELVQQALSCDSLTLQQMYSISQLPKEQQESALRETVDGKKPRQNGKKMARLKCELASGAVVTLSTEGDGWGMDEVIENLAELVKAAKKAKEEGLDSKTFERVLADKARA